jgi:phosphonoacetaldehyde hydrolase
MTKSIQGIIFDWAGTIVDFGCMAPVAVFVDLFGEYGVNLSLSNAREPMGLAKIDHLRSLFDIGEVAEDWVNIHGAFPAEEMIHEMYRRSEELMSLSVIKYAAPITGAYNLMEQLRSGGIKIGSTTGYSGPIMKTLTDQPVIKEIMPDCIVTSTDVPQGRPKPWMCYLNSQIMDVYPLWQMIKIGDTVADIAEGLHAGMWTIGLTVSGNEAGLTKQEFEGMADIEVSREHERITSKLRIAGAHYTARGIWDCEDILEEIGLRISKGEKP